MTQPPGPPPPPPGGYGAPPPPPPPPPGGYGAPPPAGGYGAPGVNPYGNTQVEVPGKGVVPLASIGQRLLGFIIDGIIIAIPATILYVALAAVFLKSADCVTVQTEFGASTSCTGGGGAIAGFFLVWILVFVLTFLYLVGLIATRGQTVGGMIMKIRAVRTTDGGLPGWGPAFKKWFLPFIVGFIPCVGGLVSLAIYFSPMWDSGQRMQGYQDKWADLYVVKDGPQFRS